MVGSMKLDRRLAALERGVRKLERIVIPLISARLGESSDDAVARHVAEGGDLPAVAGDRVNVIVLVPVAPAGWAA